MEQIYVIDTISACNSRFYAGGRWTDWSSERWEEFDVRRGWTLKACHEYLESFLIRHVQDL